MVVKSNHNTNNDNQPLALTFEDISDMLKEYNALYKKLTCEAKDKPDCYIGLRAKGDHSRIYKVTLIKWIEKTKTFLIRWPTYMKRDNYFENIPAGSGRFVNPEHANISESSFIAESYPTTITITNNNYRHRPGPYNMEGKSSPEYGGMNAAMQASMVEEFPEEQREGNPGPHLSGRRQVRFQEEAKVMNNPNYANQIYYMGNMSEQEGIEKAIAESLRAAGVSSAPNIEAQTLPEPKPQVTTRDLSELEFDLVIDEIPEHSDVKAPGSMTKYEQKTAEYVLPDFLIADKAEGLGSVDLYDGFTETPEEWLERIRRTNMVSESDHMKADIFLE